MNILDDRGYIEVYNANLTFLGYVGNIDYNSCTFKIVDSLDKASRYLNDEMLLYDNNFVCSYCYCEEPIITKLHYCYGFF